MQNKTYAAIIVVAIVSGCGGGGSSSTDANATSYNCSANPVATIGIQFSDAQKVFGGKVLQGKFMQQGVGPGGHATLTMQPDGAGGSFGTPLVFSLTTICTNTATPQTYFLSGTWADNTKIVNVQFDAQSLRTNIFPMPSSWNGPDWYYVGFGI